MLVSLLHQATSALHNPNSWLWQEAAFLGQLQAALQGRPDMTLSVPLTVSLTVTVTVTVTVTPTWIPNPNCSRFPYEHPHEDANHFVCYGAHDARRKLMSETHTAHRDAPEI